MTNLRSLSDLFKAAMKLAAACAFATVIAAAVAAQDTNTFPGSGNAGVNTTSPPNPLTLARSGSSPYTSRPANELLQLVDKTDNTPQILFASAYNGMTLRYTGTSGTGSNQRLGVITGGGIEAFVINSDGNIGIGTTGPKTRFDIKQSSDTFVGGLHLRRSSTNDTWAVVTGNDNSLYMGYANNASGADAQSDFTVYPLVLTSAGNVGIGTATPDTWAKLHVYNASGAGIDVQSASAASWSRLRLVTGTRTYGWFAGDSSQADAPNKIGLYDYTAGAFRMMFDSSGNVGVGTSNPGYKFDVQSGQINASGGLCIAGDCKTAWSQVGGGGSSQWTGTGSIYYNGGNVGIGTTSPSDILHVGGGFLSTIRNEMSTWLAQNVAGGETDWSNNAYYNSGWKYRLADKASQIQQLNGDIRFFTAGSGTAGSGVTFSEKLTILQGGNVGIGTTSPADRLVVRGSGSESATTIDADAAQQSTLYFSSAGSKKTAIYRPSNSNDLRFNVVGVGDALTLQAATGSVGIGTASPASGYKLDVNGNTNVTGNLNVTGNINAKYQDLAEWVPSSEQLSAGTVVVLDTTKSNQVISSGTAYDTRVAGVISAQPGITLGEGGEGKVLVATTGRVRVKVDATRGVIQIGDLLVTSDVSGVAMKSEAVEFAGRKMHMPGTIIGKALEPLAKGSGEILVLLSLQ